MSIETEAEEFIKMNEPKAYHCTDCKRWSVYSTKGLPKDWEEIEEGYHCGNCKDKRK